MKLIGSLSEQRERETLVASNAELRDGQTPLALALQSHGVDLNTAYVLEWIPEQAEDLFVVLVGRERVVRLEVARSDGSIVAFDESALAAYVPTGRPAGLRLAVALDLVRSAA
jgi:hypothetical protein